MLNDNFFVNQQNEYNFDPTYGYDLDKLLKINPPVEPEDFDTFWEQRYQKALNVQPNLQLSATSETQHNWRVFTMSYHSTQQFLVRGWLLLPTSGVIERGFVIGHGYGGRESPDFHLPFENAALLFLCFRGLGQSTDSTISSEPYWHVLHHIEDKNRYVLGGCVEDIWLGVSALLGLYPHLAGHIGYLGLSFAGGIGALALAFEKRIAKAHFNVPSFGHQPLRLRLPSLGSAYSVQNYYKTHKKQTVKTLRYYDAATAAKRIRVPVHCACALFDPCVAPPGQFAIFNALSQEKQLFVLDAGHHSYANQITQEQALLNDLNLFFSTL